MKIFLPILLFWGILLGIVLIPEKGKAQQTDSIFQKIEDFGSFILFRNHDTNYISNYGEDIALRLVAVNKFNYFLVSDKINNSRIRYRPVRDISLGMGVSYRWFALDITFSLGLRNNSEFENTRSFDFQGRMFSSKQYISTTIQYYQGFQMGSSSGLKSEVSEASQRREDIRTMNFGLQYLFALNYTRFSLKAPFVFNEIQRKSAGSPLVGASFGMFTMDADSSIIPPEINTSFDSTLYMRNLSVLMVGISAGYMYTFVYKQHYFLTLGIIPGLNVNGGDFFNKTRDYISPNIHLKFNSMNAIGYNGRKFHAGFNFSLDSYFVKLDKKMFAQIGHGRFTVFVGYRFHRGGKNK